MKSQEGLSHYLSEVDRNEPLSREDEHELAIRAQRGDKSAVDRLVRANLRHVVSISLGYRRYGVRVDELIAEGNVGLMVALSKFDPERGTRFVTYAAHWIRAYVLDYVIRSHSMVSLGAGPLRSKIFFRLRRERAKLLSSGATTTEVNETLADRFGTTPEKLALLSQRLDSRDVSLDHKPFDDGPSAVEALPSPAASQEDEAMRSEESANNVEAVRRALAELDARERFIARHRIMADAADELSLAEIGRRLGVSRERARQLEARTKSKLKAQLTGAAAAPPASTRKPAPVELPVPRATPVPARAA